MECILPGWATTASLLAMILIAGGAGLGVMGWCSRVGKRRHPAMTFGDQHSRTLWDSLGVFLGVFIVFPVVGVLFFEVVRPPLCDTVGVWQSRPSYPPPDFDRMRYDIDRMIQELNRQ